MPLEDIAPRQIPGVGVRQREECVITWVMHDGFLQEFDSVREHQVVLLRDWEIPATAPIGRAAQPQRQTAPQLRMIVFATVCLNSLASRLYSSL